MIHPLAPRLPQYKDSPNIEILSDAAEHNNIERTSINKDVTQ